MLAGLRHRAIDVEALAAASASTLSPRGLLALALRFYLLTGRSLRLPFCRAFRSAKNACRQIAHGRAFELPRGAPRAFLSAVSAIAEQSRHRFTPTKEVHLKPVRLFLGAWLGVDATNVLLGVGISSFFHGSCDLTNDSK